MKINNYSILKTAALSMLLGFSALQANAQMPPLKACPPNFTPTFSTQNCAAAGVAIQSIKTTGGLTNFSNLNTGCAASSLSYSDYTGNTSMVVTQEAGKNVTIDITWKGSGNYASTLTKIFVDWNRDGEFDDVDEYASNPGPLPPFTQHPHLQNSNTTKSITFKVPGDAKQGLTRMRIITGSLQLFAPQPAVIKSCQALGGCAGEAEDYRFEVINPCVPPSVLSIANKDDHAADFAWSPRENAEFYEYIITPVDTIPHDTVVGFSFTKDIKFRTDTFQCDTKYYIMLRSICDTAGKIDREWDKSVWLRDSFTTDPCCYAPDITVDQIMSTTARVSWLPVNTAVGYEYVVSTVDKEPTIGGAKTTSTTVPLQGLAPKTTYCVFVRSRCTPTPLSGWTKYCFKTLGGVSVKDISTDKVKLEAFPNPVQDKVTIQLSGVRYKDAKLQIMDLTGKTIYNAAVNDDKVIINTNNLPAGLYIIKYSDDQHNEVIRVTKR